jgi:hypothetical protein
VVDVGCPRKVMSNGTTPRLTEMTRFLIPLWLALLMVPSAEAQTGDSQSRTRALQNEWHTCLNNSYRIATKKFDDRNAAAEYTFDACKTEEDHLMEYQVATTGTTLGFSSLKAAMKGVLIKDGRLKLLR